MKYIIAILFTGVFSICVYSQCIVDAGEDVILCVTPFNDVQNEVQLNARIISGTPPFTIKWFVKSSIVDTKFSNDSILNPLIIRYDGVLAYDIYYIYIKVIDSIGSEAFDSLGIRISFYGLLPIGTDIHITKGDTVQIEPFVSTLVFPFHAIWTPNLYVSDTNALKPKVYPPKAWCIIFELIDSAGCRSEWGGQDWYIYVHPTGIADEPVEVSNLFANFHNPIHANSVFSIKPDMQNKTQVQVFNEAGQLLYNGKLGEKLEIGKITGSPGIYLIRLSDEKGYEQSLRVLKE